MVNISCRVFVDGAYHDEIKASADFDADGYQYSIDDLSPGQTYDITVKVCVNYSSESRQCFDTAGWATHWTCSL